MNEIKKLLELLDKMPKIESDWNGTNHYEIQVPTSDDEYWWLTVGDIDFDGHTCETIPGKRLGLIMDISAQAKKAEDEIKSLIGGTNE